MVGADVNLHIVATINRGTINIVEPNLYKVVKNAINTDFLQEVLKPQATGAFLIAVLTPFKGVYQPDLFYLEAAMKSLILELKQANLVILKSTSPASTTERCCSG